MRFMFDVVAVKDACVAWIRQFFEENGRGCNAVIGVRYDYVTLPNPGTAYTVQVIVTGTAVRISK